MRAREFVQEQQATAQQVLAYINKTHHEPFQPGEKMHAAVMAHPRWQLQRVPLLNLNIPDQEYDDVDYDDAEPESDPYGRVMMIEPGHAGEVSQYLIDKKPIVIDADRYIIDGNHRAWAAKYLLNRDYIMAWMPVSKVNEISDERLQDYLHRAGKRVDSRLERMARARQRLNKGYEIYRANEPTKIVDRFEADTPADAQRYYQDYIERYESDVDYDLRLRRGTGIMEFAPSPGRDDNDDVPDPIFVLANRWWNAAEKQPQIESVLNSMGWSIQQVESEDDAVQLQHRDGTSYFISADDFDPDVFENFADGKVKGKSRPGRVKRAGASCKGSVTDLRARAKKYGGEKGRMYHWCANMKSGRKKNK